jgi:replicative DNA helicase
MLASANELAKAAYNLEVDVEETVPAHIMGLTKILTSENKTVSISKGLSALYDDIQERCANPQDIYGLSTGIKGIDEITGGLQKSELLVLSGLPGLGKSVLALQIAFNFGKDSRPGVIYELEMSMKQTLRRSLSVSSQVPVRTMKTGRVLPDQWQEIDLALSEMESYPMFFSESSSWTTASLRSDLIRLKQLHKIEWFVVDYLGLLRDRFPGVKDTAEKEGMITEELHNIVKELDLAGLAIQSMTKEGMKTGGITGVKGGSGLGHGADVIVVMDKSGDLPDGTELINFKFEKNRESDSGKNLVQLVKGAHFPSFNEYKGKTF